MSDRTFESTLRVPASGIAFASGAALIGSAIAGPIGGVVGAVVGGIGGVITEVASQKANTRDERKAKADPRNV